MANRIIVNLLLLAAALACYFAGSMLGVGIIVVAGLLFEGFFWFRLLRRRAH